jgi:PTS system nitrogen regulatory IIA component
MKLSIAQVARALDLPEGKVERWIRQGRIPLARRDNTCTFDRQTLQRWAAQHNLLFQPDGQPKQASRRPSHIGLAAALQRGGVLYDVDGTCQAEVLAAAVEQMTFLPPEKKAPLLAKLEERETLASTGIGNGIAIPHPREPESLGFQEPTVAACFLSTAIDYQALDGRPVSILFILLSPTVQAHLQLLSKLSFCLRQDAFVAFLTARPTPEALMARFEDLEPSGHEPDQRPR